MNTKNHRRAADHKQARISAIVRSGQAQARRRGIEFGVTEYLRRYFANVAIEDLDKGEPRALSAAALNHLEFGDRRFRGRHRLRIYNPDRAEDGYESSHTVVEIVNDDMPFLVDSVGMAIERAGFGVHLTVHPLLPVRRQRSRIAEIKAGAKSKTESFIRLEIDRVSAPETFQRITDELEATLCDVRVAVADWTKMRQKLLECAAEIDSLPSTHDASVTVESAHLLEWMAEDRFTLLGYHEYRLRKNKRNWSLLPKRGSGLGILSADHHEPSKVLLSPTMRKHASSPECLIITKANSRSTVHRASYLDYVGVKVFDDNGQPIGEKRFLGLFTSQAYSESPRSIPLLRLKVHRVLTEAGFDPSSHRGKALAHILDNFPRDELLQSSIEDLSRTSAAILNLQDRRQVRLFIRRDDFRRFFSCLIYVPRDKYNTRVRHRLEKILLDAFGGHSVDSSVQISDGALARLHSIVATSPDRFRRVDVSRLERKLSEAVITWQDHLRDALVNDFGEEDGLELFEYYGDVFPLAYQEDLDAAQGAQAIKRLHKILSPDAQVEDRFVMEASQQKDAAGISFKVFTCGAQLALSDVLPVLENMGTRVIEERPYALRLVDGTRVWLQDFALEIEGVNKKQLDALCQRFARGFGQVLTGEAENDRINQLVLDAAVEPEQLVLIRAYVRYLMQLGLPFGLETIAGVLAAQPRYTRMWVELFYARFDPSAPRRGRAALTSRLTKSLQREIEKAGTLDEDRILRALSDVQTATVRTNFFRQDERFEAPVLALKLRSGDIEEAPQPRPEFEIFIYSPAVEGVHLRAGMIARGGIRYSDRRDDFRTEVLGLMKAQTVKNTVIVPTGAKGGFIAKSLPDTEDRRELQQAVIACYQSFIGGLLDVTDNLVGDQLVHPPQTVCHDDDDPYLVVAADKGTAAFSDIANAISESREFWLGDAFASGGSAGYDHKKMGITARGAWEAVKRHFRELGINTQTDEFDVVAIGDMGGDVFGNGMLLSKTLRLRAAFNHLHIFIDPNPDAARSYRERRRLFKGVLGWDHYDTALISRGGGVFSRHDKRIKLSREIRTMLDVDVATMTPLELINALLKMPTDLLWNGGIGTYAKASTESHAEAGDRSNDGLRVNAGELGARVVGEGGNLGLTQAARVEYALAGGKINTDFIDNSAGVDSSDREVNIKILLRLVATERRMSRVARDKLLAAMTDSVAEKVLDANYAQTQSISMLESRARERLQEYTQLIRTLENSGLLHRALEGLPDEKQISERKQQRLGLTRPELAVLLSYAKIDLFQSLAGRSIIRQNYHLDELSDYFPEPLPRRYRDLLIQHRLSNEILATRITNSIVNRMGPTFATRIATDTGASAVTIARAYAIVRDITGARAVWHDIEALDYELAPDHQYEMMFAVGRHLRHACYWLINRRGDNLQLDPLLSEFGPRMKLLHKQCPRLLSPSQAAAYQAASDRFAELGATASLASRMALLPLTRSLLDIADIAGSNDRTLVTAELYVELGRALSLDWLKDAVESLDADGQWQAMARSSLRDGVFDSHRILTERLLGQARKGSVTGLVADFIDREGGGADALQMLIRDMRQAGQTDFATLTVAQERLRTLVAGAMG